MKSFDTKRQLCPHCGYYLDACTAVTGEQEPDEGDLTVCIECHTVLQFGADLIYQVIDASTLPMDIQTTLATVIGTLAAMKMPER